MKMKRKPTRLEKRLKKKKQALAERELKERPLTTKELEQESTRKEKQRMKRESIFHAWYWGRVWKSDGFDGEGLETIPLGMWRAMRPHKCETPNDCPLIVHLYAKIGLHRYNMLQGTNLQLHHVVKYNREGAYSIGPSSYYITLVAENPVTHSLVTFETSSHEHKKHQLNVWFYIARLEDPTATKGMLWRDLSAPQFCNVTVPKWQSEIDKQHLFSVQEAELKENDWIRLYLELGFVTTNRQITNPELSDLKIVEVMVETKEKAQLPLTGFKDATFYIKYDQDLGEGQVCKRRAIIRRTVDLRTKRMSLMGDYYLESEADSEHGASTSTKAPQHTTRPVKEAGCSKEVF